MKTKNYQDMVDYFVAFCNDDIDALKFYVLKAVVVAFSIAREIAFLKLVLI